ncbi:MAG: PQQ-binding-like beta-propeller repeat protein, partial [Treponema sp.]|nr:PQQ-binding-like beta-propeller repeat protein [Treponema sp.]
KKAFIYLYIFINFLKGVSLFAEEEQGYIRRLNFKNQEPKWSIFMTGEAVTEPQLTSYGFAMLSDGRTVTACTDEGKVIWEKPLQGRPAPYLTILDGDFLVAVTNNQTLNLINPAGIILWQVKVPFKITSTPFIGRDSRIFVKGKNYFACYDIKGLCKWSLETESLSTLPIQEFPDGSFLSCLTKTENGKTIGLRISPFGEVMEEIIFSSIVSSLSSCKDGILITFEEGGVGLCMQDKDDKTQNVWAHHSSHSVFAGTSNEGMFFITTSDEKAVLLSQKENATKATFFKTATGEILNSFTIPSIQASQIIYKRVFEDEIIIADSSYATSFTQDGKILWLAQLPSMNSGSNQWNQIMYTQNGFLILCKKSWELTSFRVVQAVGRKSHTVLKRKNDYNDFLSISTSLDEFYSLSKNLDADFTSDKRLQELHKGLYAEKEKAWASELWNTANFYLSSLKTSYARNIGEKTVFETDVKGTNKMILQLSSYGTNMFPPLVAKLLKAEKNESNLRMLIESAGKCAYDPENVLLDALEKTIQKLHPSSTSLLIPSCTSIYEICKFMGRPAFFSHGKSILSKLLSAEYDRRIRLCARETLSKIAQLEKQQKPEK